MPKSVVTEVRFGSVTSEWNHRAALPELLSRFYVFTGKEGNVWEMKVLVCREHSAGKQVRLTHVIQEAADVSIKTGIDAE